MLFEVAPDAVAGLTIWLRETWGDRVEDIVPSHSAVLVRAPGRVAEIASGVRTGSWSESPPPPDGRVLRIPVHYDGPDLAEVAERTGLTPDRVVAEHFGAEHVVRHFGFSPGFPYLAGSPEVLDVPRRHTPRESVPAGSIAIAGTVTVIYPGGTPGGWRLIGRTAEPLVLWDVHHDPPNTFALGDRVRFEPAT